MTDRTILTDFRFVTAVGIADQELAARTLEDSIMPFHYVTFSTEVESTFLAVVISLCLADDTEAIHSLYLELLLIYSDE
jgi:hypothetical protein